MTQQDLPTASSANSSGGDPWHAFGYLVSGVAVYGVLGWLADRWLGTSFLVVAGILLGTGFGLYLTFNRFQPAATLTAGQPAGRPDKRGDGEK